MFRADEIIVLIGAGCSADADIPTSQEMIIKVEKLLEKNTDWKGFARLYHYIKSSIIHADGIKGNFGSTVDIERLVNVLGELEKNENSILYPFIGSWTPRLLELAGYEFNTKIKEFKQKILTNLKGWVSLDDYNTANYYRTLFDFQSELEFALRIFSLNYDLCLEKNIPTGKGIERGFDSQTRTWDWRRFESIDTVEQPIYLYKLHGSIDWKRDKEQGNILREVDCVPDEPDLIFGTDYKMQSVDPYLFYAYELRKFSLDAGAILVIGYSFGDEHINSILRQALDHKKDTKLILVSRNAEKDQVIKKLHPKDGEQIIVENKGAKEFLNDGLRINKIDTLLGKIL